MNRTSQRWAIVPLMTGAAVFAGGSAVLAGWIFNIQVLMQPVLDVPSMRANTAIAFLTSGLALLIFSTRRFTGVALLLAWLVIALSVATLSQDLLGWDLGIDQRLFIDAGSPVGFHPGRMSPLTAFCFLSVGLALLVALRRGQAWRSQGLALMAFIVATVSLASYVLSLHHLYGVASYRAMAIHTAVLFLILAVGVLFLQPEEGLTGLLWSDSVSGKATRRILPATIIIPIVVDRVRLAGESRGLADTGLGVAVFVVCTIVLLSGVILINAKLVHDADAKRRDAEDALRRANDLLENRVLEKTAEARRSQAQAAENAEMFFHLFEFAPDAIVAVDHHGVIERVNVKTEVLFGYDRDELVGQPVEMLIPERFASRHVGHRDVYLGHPRSRPMGAGLELFGRRKDGREFPVDVMLSPTESPRGRLVLGVIRDITERRLAEESLRERQDRLQAGQRMEAMGRLAGGVAHDFNNMMTVVTGYSELLLGQVAADHPSSQALREIKKAGDRCAALTRHLLAFSRGQMLTPSALDLNAIVADLCNMFPILLGEDIRVVSMPAPNLWHVRADQAQIEQVVVNIVINARDAMPGGGTLTIRTANVDLDAQDAFVHPEIQAGPFVCLTIADSGRGMDDATKARIFDPFFTTKPVGEGTGLGLSTVYGVIKQSGGYIYADSDPGQGATFRIYLPRVDAPAATAPPPARNGVSDGLGTVLLVEDEESVRRLLSDMLARAGYGVMQASGGEAALQLCEQHDEAIHLVITDVVMPGMSGGELVERLKALRPDTRVLLMSGYAQDVVVQHAIVKSGTAFLQKPFTASAFLARVRDVLDGAAR